MNNSPEIKIFETPKAVATAFAVQLHELVISSVTPVNIALSGGSTPALLFDILSQDYKINMPWERIHFWWGDERCVSPTDPESNYKMTFDHLFSKINIDSSRIHRIKGELSPQKANDDYSAEIEKYIIHRDGWPVFDLIILGMGNDGHTASIFPHQMELLQTDKICEVATHPDSGQQRVTLTGKVLNNADRIFFLVTGKSKKERVTQIIRHLDEAERLPSSHIQPHNGKLVFYFDREAAAGLNS